MAKKLNIRGTVLGVPFDFTIWPAGEGEIKISGEAGGKPLHFDLIVDEDNDRLSATGELLGNPISISGHEVA